MAAEHESSALEAACAWKPQPKLTEMPFDIIERIYLQASDSNTIDALSQVSSRLGNWWDYRAKSVAQRIIPPHIWQLAVYAEVAESITQWDPQDCHHD